jgi:hypothetical protein
MLKEMRRKDRQMSDEDTKTLLKNTNYGILSTVGKDNVPYGVPISFAYNGQVIYLHGAMEGHKLDNIAHNNHVCFTVVDNNYVELLPSEFSTNYKSAVVFGTISIVEDMEEKQKALEATIEKYSHDFYDKGLKYINSALKATKVLKIEIIKMTGKTKQ